MSGSNAEALRALLELREAFAGAAPRAVRAWVKPPGDVPSLAYVEYNEIVHRLMERVQAPGVIVRSYQPNQVAKDLEDPGFIERASIDEVRAVLTYIVRGERFCEGHVGRYADDGTVGRALARLGVLLGG